MKRDRVLRRSQLVTPAARPSVIAKALVSGADSVIVDLEDAVPADRKDEARRILAQTLAEAPIQVGEVAVRINGLHTDWWLDDMQALRGLPIASIVIPKVQSPGDVVCVAKVASQLRQGGLAEVSLQPMIETPGAVLQAKDIAEASPLNVALLFGIGDYIAETGMRFGATGPNVALGRRCKGRCRARLRRQVGDTSRPDRGSPYCIHANERRAGRSATHHSRLRRFFSERRGGIGGRRPTRR